VREGHLDFEPSQSFSEDDRENVLFFREQGSYLPRVLISTFDHLMEQPARDPYSFSQQVLI